MADIKIPVSANVGGLQGELSKIPKMVEQTARQLNKFTWNPVNLKAIQEDLKKAERLVADFQKRTAGSGSIGGGTAPAMPAGFTVTAPGASVPGSAPSTPSTRRTGGRGAYTHAPDWHQVGNSFLGGFGGGFGQVASYGARGAIAGGRDGGPIGGGLGLLRGLGIGALALGAFKVGQGVTEGYDLSKERAATLDSLKRQMGDLGISFDKLKSMSEAAAVGLGVNSKEAAVLAAEFNRLSKGADGSTGALAGSVRVGLGLDRAYGMQDGVGGRFLAGMRNIDPRQNNRELALLVAEAIEGSGMTARADEVMQAFQSYASSTSRMMLGMPNMQGYASGYTSLMRMPGVTSDTAAGIISQASSSVARMGSAGEAGQNFILTALNRGGALDPIQAMALAEGGLFGTRGSVFGRDSALGRFVGSGMPAGDSKLTNFDAIRSHLSTMGGDKWLQLNAAKNLFGVSSHAQAAALMQMDTGQAGNLKRALEVAGIDISTMSESGIANLARIGGTGTKEQLLAAAQSGRQETEFTRMQDSLKALDDIKINTGDKLIGPINTIRDAMVVIAGKLAPDSAFVTQQKNMAAASGAGGSLAAFDAETQRGLDTIGGDTKYANWWNQDRAKQRAVLATRKLSGVDPALLKQLGETDSMLGMPAGTSALQFAKESGFNPNAVSPAGAMGLAQVMPSTLKSLEKRFGRKLDPSNQGDAVLMHRELMRENLAHFGNLPDALKAYNAGWDKSRWNNPETASYTDGILSTQLPDTGAGAGRGSHGTQSVEVAGTFTLQDSQGRQVAAPLQTRVSVPRGSGVR